MARTSVKNGKTEKNSLTFSGESLDMMLLSITRPRMSKNNWPRKTFMPILIMLEARSVMTSLNSWLKIPTSYSADKFPNIIRMFRIHHPSVIHWPGIWKQNQLPEIVFLFWTTWMILMIHCKNWLNGWKVGNWKLKKPSLKELNTLEKLLLIWWMEVILANSW